ncbi:L-threonylcarbamoyladenylate synthase [Porticoccus sp. W117]|uniref:L-threonylcarbamoyladenylate synthase n=1 Tax=Porticoccus sp. W117 TaxID=3054777 RepID=UPI00259A5A22|nr:L-threonylcarbamoyladenylate synthase [Porticoccus sp. W117]MDM3870448.1 L-threonylcarbamoyladenylate synthase [Porticoccus sp. W117]
MCKRDSNPSLDIAASALRTGGVVAYPTEAVYGLGCDPDNQQACEAILALKQRNKGMGMILIARHIEQLEFFLIGLSDQQRATLSASWPGPITWLIPNNGQAPDWVTGGRDTLAVRVTDHPVAAALCDAFGGPLVSTSANPHGKPPAITADQVADYFPEGLSAIVDGPLGQQAKPTEIRDLATGDIIRPA